MCQSSFGLKDGVLFYPASKISAITTRVHLVDATFGIFQCLTIGPAGGCVRKALATLIPVNLAAVAFLSLLLLKT